MTRKPPQAPPVPVKALAWILRLTYEMRSANVLDVVPAAAGVAELDDLEAVASWFSDLPGVNQQDAADLFDLLPAEADRADLMRRAEVEAQASGPQGQLEAAARAWEAADAAYRAAGSPDTGATDEQARLIQARATAREALHRAASAFAAPAR